MIYDAPLLFAADLMKTAASISIALYSLYCHYTAPFSFTLFPLTFSIVSLSLSFYISSFIPFLSPLLMLYSVCFFQRSPSFLFNMDALPVCRCWMGKNALRRSTLYDISFFYHRYSFALVTLKNVLKRTAWRKWPSEREDGEKKPPLLYNAFARMFSTAVM